jgi:hypothetical protein
MRHSIILGACEIFWRQNKVAVANLTGRLGLGYQTIGNVMDTRFEVVGDCEIQATLTAI